MFCPVTSLYNPAQLAETCFYFFKEYWSVGLAIGRLLRWRVSHWNYECLKYNIYYSGIRWVYYPPEAQKPKTFQIAAVYAQKNSGRSAWLHFSRHIKKARNLLSWHIKKARNLLWRHIKKGVILSRDILKKSGWIWNCLYSINPVRTVSKPSGQFLNQPDSFKTVRTVSVLSG